MGRYWSDRENDMVIQWNTTTNPREELLIYKVLAPKIRLVILNLMLKHFTQSVPNKPTLEQEVIDHVLIQLKNTKLKPNSNYFYLINTYVKNYLVTKLVLKKNEDKFNDSHISYTNENNTDDFNQKLELNGSIEPIEIDNFNESNLNLLISHLKQLNYEATQHTYVRESNEKPNIVKKYRELIEFNNAAMEFLIKFHDIEYDHIDLFQYITNNTNLSKRAITNYLKYVFNIVYFSNFNTQMEKSEPNNKKIEKYKIDWELDDYTPDMDFTDVGNYRRYNFNRTKTIISS